MTTLDTPRIAVICIGSELLRGSHVNSNATFIHQLLYRHGYQVVFSAVVGDRPPQMSELFEQLWREYDIVITTGGLGPTSDDLTLSQLAALFHCGLVEDEEQRERVRQFFQRRGREMTDSNRSQYLKLERGELLPNRSGTAPGQLVRESRKLWLSLPGVPFEMKTMMEEQLLPLLQQEWPAEPVEQLELRLAGISESALYDLMTSKLQLDKLGEVSFLPSLQGHLLVVRHPAATVRDTLTALLNEHLVSCSGLTLVQAIVENLNRGSLTVTTAESCSGGLLGELITAVPGSSEVYPGGVITYSNEQKSRLLGVPEQLLEEHGAVSQPVVEAMAAGVRRRMRSDYALAISGIAGPTGGSPEKPVGTVWHALDGPNLLRSSHKLFDGNRDTNRQQAAGTALAMLFHQLRETNCWEPL